jgi:AcrR family transcriptional regulator
MSKKETILQTAAKLFAAQGFEATTTFQIAREAGATEPLIYYHFKGKDDLFTRIIDATFSEYFSRIDALEKNRVPPSDRSKSWLNSSTTSPKKCRTRSSSSPMPARPGSMTRQIYAPAMSKNTAAGCLDI